MFFIGIFGTNNKVVPSGYIKPIDFCPCCKQSSVLHVTHSYQYFHGFFIPLFKFKHDFFATCTSCASVFAVPKELGEKASNQGNISASFNELTLLKSNFSPRCPSCNTIIENNDSFCRHCGKAL